ncbi:MAG: hypothetical protein IJZ59_02470 [Alphaproteobacteria bacterium]|nr:hypothetical protein [Alphaproteobacteria bacterium]
MEGDMCKCIKVVTLLFMMMTASDSYASVVESSKYSQNETSEVWQEVSSNISELNALMHHCSNPVEENGVYKVAVDLSAAGVSAKDVQVKVIKGGTVDTLVVLVLQRRDDSVNVMSSSISLSKPVNEKGVETKFDDDDILIITIPIKYSAQLIDDEKDVKVLPELRAAQEKMQRLLNVGVVWDTRGYVRGEPIDATMAQIDVDGVSYTRSSDAYDYNIIINSMKDIVIYDSMSNQKVITPKTDDKMFKTYLIGTDKELSQYYQAGTREINGEKCRVYKSDIEGGELCISEEWGIPIYRKNTFWKYEQTISNIGVGGIRMSWFDIPQDAINTK